MKKILFAFFVTLAFVGSAYSQDEPYDPKAAYKQMQQYVEEMGTLLQKSDTATEQLNAKLKVLEELAAKQEPADDSLVATFALLLMNEVSNSENFSDIHSNANIRSNIAIMSRDTNPGWEEAALEMKANFKKHMERLTRLEEIFSRAKAALPPKYAKFL